MKKMRKQFIKLLGIHAVSGNEKPVRDYLKPILGHLLDTVTIDSYGNLLGEKKVGTGEGATVMLSAHMDTVKGVLKERNLVFNGDYISSDIGALGADDRAGIAIIMEVLRNINETRFNGTIKVAFSREEEIGCVGSKQIDSKWYSDVDLAIVVDRRGNRDIVTGCYGAFCCNEVGYFMEGVSASIGMNWRAVEGGISDAYTFSAKGINSINLSAGYYNEHTANECVSLSQMEETVLLINATLDAVSEFVDQFTEVPESNEWSYVYKYNGKNKYYYGKGYSDWYDDYDKEWDYLMRKEEEKSQLFDTIYAEEKDRYGDVYVYEVHEGVIIQQGDNEIVLSKESLKSLIKQINGETLVK